MRFLRHVLTSAAVLATLTVGMLFVTPVQAASADDGGVVGKTIGGHGAAGETVPWYVFPRH